MLKIICTTLTAILCSFFCAIPAEVTRYPVVDPYWAIRGAVHYFNEKHDKALAIEKEHLKNDPGFLAAIWYFQSPEWKKIVDDIMESPIYMQFIGIFFPINIYLTLAIVCIGIHINSLQVPENNTTKPNLASIQNDLDNLLLFEEISNVQFIRSIVWDEGMKEIHNVIATKQTMKIARKFRRSPEVKKAVKRLSKMKCNAKKYMLFFYKICGWTEANSVDFSS